MTALYATLAVLAAVALAILALRAYKLSRVFQPVRASAPLEPNPRDLGLDFEDVHIAGGAGTLHGWWVPSGHAAPTLLMCHGNAGNIAWRVESVAFYRHLGFNVLIFDYRGYGLSAGRPSEQGLYDDAASVWRYLTEERGVAASDIVLLGRSLGGGVATHLALECEPGAVIIESTFTSINDLARERYPRLPLWRLPWASFDNASRIAAIRSPLLLVHSVEDEVIPFAHGEKLNRIRGNKRELVRIHGSHSGGYFASGEAYAAPIREFLEDTGFTLTAD